MTDTDDMLARVSSAYPEGVPNLLRTLTANPAVFAGFVALDESLERDGVLSACDRLLVGLIAALDMDCAYCRAALSKHAREAGTPADVIAAVEGRTPPGGYRTRALVEAAQRILATHGRLPQAEIAHFGRQGLDRAALLEIVAVIGEFTIATHANNLMRTRIDPEYRDGTAPAQP